MALELGNAQGTISINTQGVTAAVPVVKGAAAQMTKSFGGIAPAAVAAQSGVSGLATTLKGLAGAAGFSVGIAGAVLLGQKLLQFGADSVEAASALTESMNKIKVAFGGSSQAVLDWSRGSAKSLGQSRQQALEAASSFGLLFSTMGLGEGESAQMSKRLVQLAADMASINNISPDEALAKLRSGLVGETEPLRAVGVLLDEATVKAKAMAMGLAPTESALTQQNKVMARYQLIMEQTTKTQGDFARTSGELANQQRTLAGNLEDTMALLGQAATPATTWGITGLNEALEATNKALDEASAKWDRMSKKELASWSDGPASVWLRQLQGVDEAAFQQNRQLAQNTSGTAPWGTRGAPPAIAKPPPDLSQERSAIHLDWAQGIEDLNRQTHADIIDEEASFGASRSKTVADYAKSVARDEAGFARTRLRAEMDQLDAIGDVLKDATRREAGQAADLARSLASTRSDSAERAADARADANKQLAKLDADYYKDRVKAAKDFSDNLLDAAGNLDAKQVYELQRNYARQEEEAATAHDDARKAIEEGLQERLDQEAEALAKSLRQQQENYDRQIAEGRENDRIRLEEMKADFAQRKAREDEDHAIQVAERAEDQAAQLAEMDTQHGLRMNQIRTHAIEERARLQEEADAAAIAAGVADEATRKRHEARELEEEKLWDKFHKHITDSMTIPRTVAGGPVKAYASGGYVPQSGLAYLHGGEYVMPRAAVAGGAMSSSRSVVVQPGAVVIQALPGMNEERIVRLAIDGLTRALEAAA